MKYLDDGTAVYFPLGPDSFVAMAWYLELPANMGNVMAMVYRDAPDTFWRLGVRMRRYVDALTTDGSKDQRTMFEVESENETDPADDCWRVIYIDKTRNILKTLADAAGGELTEVEVNGSTGKFIDLWRTQPFSNMREEHDGPPHYRTDGN